LDIPSLLLFHILIVHSLEHDLFNWEGFLHYSLSFWRVFLWLARFWNLCWSCWWMKCFLFQFLLYRKPTRGCFVARTICFCRLWLQGAWQMLYPLFTNPKLILQIHWSLINTIGNYMSVRCKWLFFFWVGEWQIVVEVKFSAENHW